MTCCDKTINPPRTNADHLDVSTSFNKLKTCSLRAQLEDKSRSFEFPLIGHGRTFDFKLGENVLCRQCST